MTISFAAACIATAASWWARFDDEDDPGGAVFPSDLLRGVLVAESENSSAGPPVDALSLTGAGLSEPPHAGGPGSVRRFLLLGGAGDVGRRRRWEALPREESELDGKEAPPRLMTLYLVASGRDFEEPGRGQARGAKWLPADASCHRDGR